MSASMPEGWSLHSKNAERVRVWVKQLAPLHWIYVYRRRARGQRRWSFRARTIGTPGSFIYPDVDVAYESPEQAAVAAELYYGSRRL